jgi:hypothetical protein
MACQSGDDCSLIDVRTTPLSLVAFPWVIADRLAQATRWRHEGIRAKVAKSQA